MDIVLKDIDGVRTRLQAKLESMKWTYAKTMPGCPHEWTHRKDWIRREWDFAITIMRHPAIYEVRYWYSRAVQYTDLGDWMYWTSGAPLYHPDGYKTEVWILNRAHIKYKNFYPSNPPKPKAQQSLVDEDL